MTDLVCNSSSRELPQPIAADPKAADWPNKSMIRPAHLGDITDLTELLASSFYDPTGWMYWVYPVIKFGIQADLKQRLRTEKSNYTCLTALTANGETSSADPSRPGNIAGTVEVSQRQAWPWQELSPKYAYVANLAVAPSFRRQGIAGKLLAACEALALEWEIANLYLHVMEDNLAARRLYGRAGFQLFQTEAMTATWLGLQPRRLLMYKQLT